MPSKTPYKVLCVCLGNICRSPTAEAIHQYLYRELSLNGSPLSYRNPYVLKQGGR